MAHEAWGTVPVGLTYLEANQLLAAGEQRVAVMEGHVANGVPLPDLAPAIAQTLHAMTAIRRAFGLDVPAAVHEARMGATLAANCDELEMRAVWGDR